MIFKEPDSKIKEKESTSNPISEKFIHQMEKDWDERADRDAFHYVDSKKAEWDDREFFDKGKMEVYQFTEDFFRKMNFDSSKKRMLEIGCGVGRMTRGFSEIFQEVYAVDVSYKMISIGKDLNRNLRNVYFIKNNGVDFKIFPDEYFDFVFAYIVFQHLPSKEILLGYLYDISRVLKHGGLFKFQLRKRRRYFLPKWAVRMFFKIIGRKLKSSETWLGITVTQKELMRMVGKAGLEILNLEDDSSRTNFWCSGRKPLALQVKKSQQ